MDELIHLVNSAYQEAFSLRLAYLASQTARLHSYLRGDVLQKDYEHAFAG